jgi:prepilin-type N-terminal cleavage/methylation domain-containing protein
MKRARARGFTLVEILVVIGIIAITAAVALPNISGYIRASRIRSAHDAVAGALQKARTMAIMRNTQMGIVFVVASDSVFWVHIEDTIPGVSPAGDVGFTRQGLNYAAANPLVSTRYELPSNVQFAANVTDCPEVPGFAPTQAFLRFDRFGLSSTAADVPAAPAVVLEGGSTTTNRVFAPTSADRAVCIIDRTTGLRRWIKIAPGGGITRG